MKKAFPFIFLLISMGALAQNDPLKDTIVAPIITELGKPDGAKVEMQIGKEGGSLKSSDGKVELVFPAGALTENVNIIIQPVTNLAPNGSGKAYWFEPSGIQFKKPVQIIITYTDEEAKTCPPDLMGLAIQNKQGQWSFIDYDSWDSTAKLLKGSIHHFTGAANVSKWKLLPFFSRIKVRSIIPLTISDISSFFEPGYDDHAEPDFPMAKLSYDKNITLWYANDFLNGLSFYGIVTGGYKGRATYEAPSSVPPGDNPVTIKAEVYLIKKNRKGQTLTLVKALTSTIQVYDEYGFRIVYQTDQLNPGGVWGTMTSKDTSLLGVRFDGKHAEIIWKINKNTSTGLYFKQGKCIATTETPGSGFLHISGMMGQLIRPARYIPESATVEIFFTKALVVMPLINYDCTAMLGGRIGNSAETKAFADKFIRTMPIKLTFKAKEYEGREVIETFGKEGTPIFYKVEIWQIKDD